jgi:predicted TPR repeat methyltransferase
MRRAALRPIAEFCAGATSDTSLLDVACSTGLPAGAAAHPAMRLHGLDLSRTYRRGAGTSAPKPPS